MNIKKFVNVLSVAGLLAVSAVTPASADTIETKLNRQQVDGKTMQLLLEDIDLIAKAYQVSLKINGNVKLDTLNFSNEGKSGVTSRYVYDESENVVDIYVTSTKSLLDENNGLNIGSMILKGTVGTSFDVVPIDGSLKIVTMANVEHSIPTVSVAGGSDFSIKDSNNGGSNNSGNNGTDDDNTGDSNVRPNVSGNWTDWTNTKGAVSNNYTWTIMLNNQVDATTVNTNNIFVVDQDGYLVEGVVVTATGTQISVNAPITGYEMNQTYTLYVRDAVKNIDGKSLNMNIKMQFTTK